MGLTGVLNIGKTALLTSQTAIQTTSHNIANVNTPGYTRQRANLAAGEPVLGGGKYLGTGVKLTGVERVYDRFINAQILDASEANGRYSALEDRLRRLEGIFNDSQRLGAADVLNGFFDAIHDVVNDASSYSARAVLLSKAEIMTDRINSLDLRLRDEIRNIESEINNAAKDINSLAAQIAVLNGKIQEIEAGGSENANDLRDERELLLKKLAEKIDMTALEDSESQQMTVLAAGGNLLAAGGAASSLTVSANTGNNNYYDVMLGDHNITDNISSGKLKGLIEARDSHFQDALTRLDILSASITKEFNVLHSGGYGLDSSTGNNFFTALSPIITTMSSNTGGATASASVQTLSSLTLDDYEIRFTSSSSFNIVNTTEDTIVSTGNSYTSGANIDFEGLRAVITNDTGSPQSGDIFRISVTKGAAQNIGMAVTDPNKFAAASTSATLPGGNANVVNMAELENSNVMANGTAVFSGYYTAIVADIGVSSGEAKTNSDAQTLVLEELESYRDSISGVSLDEEGINLLKYQHSYQAAAKVITTVDDMLNTLMSLLR
ncbi:MAG: flagellar hook-associated protein FlgK [Deltaproteobacteria bacterium]|nr:flagellar hook-associated protein FlgK [Deltaproteobacteria bacterium]